MSPCQAPFQGIFPLGHGGPWMPLAYPRTRVWQQKPYQAGKKTGWWHQLRREKRDKLMVKKHFEASLPKA